MVREECREERGAGHRLSPGRRARQADPCSRLRERHNPEVIPGDVYPRLLVTAALHDSQGQFWEPAKRVAKLRELKTDDILLLLNTNMGAGHAGSSGGHDRDRETARDYAFLLHIAGLVEAGSARRRPGVSRPSIGSHPARYEVCALHERPRLRLREVVTGKRYRGAGGSQLQVQRESAGRPAPTPGSGEFARAIVQTIRQPLLVLDGRYRVVSANPAFYRHFDVRSDDTVGRSLWELGDRQWDVAALRELLAGVLAEHETVEDFEVRHEFELLGLRTFLVNARQVFLEGEGHRLLLVAFEDVTERRRIERLLMRYTDQLRRSNRDLEEFAHAASHDLQEPLRKVRTFASRLGSSFDAAALDERQRLYLDRIEDATRRMQKRIDDLLDLARVARAEMRREDVDLEAVVASVLRDLESAIAETSAEIEVGALPRIEGDAAHLEVVFQNLVANALKYREADVAPRIRVASSRAPAPDGDEREWIAITVADEGIGFEQRYAERIFRPFERLHGRTEYEGSGIGLSVCRRVAEAHGGRMRAKGEPGEGATFEILLPTTRKEVEI